MSIKLELKNVYGNELYYPRCGKAEIFAGLTGNKTLTNEAINKIKALGYRVDVLINGREFKDY